MARRMDVKVAERRAGVTAEENEAEKRSLTCVLAHVIPGART